MSDSTKVRFDTMVSDIMAEQKAAMYAEKITKPAHWHADRLLSMIDQLDVKYRDGHELWNRVDIVVKDWLAWVEARK